MNDWPNELNGTAPLVQWLNKLRRACIRRQVIPGTDYLLDTAQKGTLLRIRTGGGSTSTPVNISSYIFVKSFDNYLQCQDGAGNLVQIAKAPELRTKDMASKVVDADSMTYTYVTAGATAYLARSVFVNGSVVPEYQRVRPPYVPFPGLKGADGVGRASKILAIAYNVGDVVSVGPAGGDATNAAGTVITLIQCCDNRVWCRKADQTTP